MKVSIAMVTYNAGAYLSGQLSSFLSQTTLPDELIVSDDGSTDETLEILKDFALRVPFEVQIHQNEKNLGCSMNFGKALSMCSGDIIFLSDQDDIWFPEKIERVLQVFKENKETLVVINDAEITDENLQPSGLSQAGQICNSGLTTDQVINGCFSAVSSKFLPILLPIETNEPAYDRYLHFLALSMNARIYIEDILQYYRRHGDNLSNHFTSITSRVSKWNSFWTVAQIDTRIPLISQLSMVKSMCAKLEQMDSVTEDVVIRKQMKEAVANLKADEEIIRERLGILQRPRYKRAFGALGFWLRGGYKTFSGFRSMAKDLMIK